MLMAFKILTMLWPFVKEMMFGQKSAKEIVREHKLLVLMLMFLAVSVPMNVFLTHRIVGISRDYIALDKKYKELESSRQHPDQGGTSLEAPIKAPVAQAETVPSPTPPPKRQVATPAGKPGNDKRYQRLQRSLTDMQAREDKDLSTESP